MSNKISELKDVLTRLVDSYEGYKDAAEKAEQERHKTQFNDLATKRYQYAVTIQEFLKTQGEDVDIDGSFLAGAHRLFMDLKNMLGDDEALLGSIRAGESNLLATYRDAMEECGFDGEFLRKLQEQYKEIETNLELINAKKKAA